MDESMKHLTNTEKTKCTPSPSETLPVQTAQPGTPGHSCMKGRLAESLDSSSRCVPVASHRYLCMTPAKQTDSLISFHTNQMTVRQKVKLVCTLTCFLFNVVPPQIYSSGQRVSDVTRSCPARKTQTGHVL